MIEIALYAAGMALIFAELFVPGAVLGVLGGGLVIYALGATWWKGEALVALPMTVLTLAAVPLMVRFAVKRLSLGERLDSSNGYRSSGDARSDVLVGAEGVALTPLRPSCSERLGDRRESVVAESGLIEKDTRVQVVKVEGYRIVVRAI